MELINSSQNSRIRNICRLYTKARDRKEQGLFIIEGARELAMSFVGGYVPDSVYICPSLFEKSEYPGILESLPTRIMCEVTESVFEKIAYRESSDGILALVKPKSHRLSDLQLPDNPFIIVLETVEKPGNLGAILRTADAAKADAVVVCDPSTDIYNPNTIRASIGCVFTVPIAVGSNKEVLAFLQNRGIQTFAADLTAEQWYHESDFTLPSAILMGAEADGLTYFWLKNADKHIKIPMRGVIDSLNVSVSTAILTFEAMRQRGF